MRRALLVLVTLPALVCADGVYDGPGDWVVPGETELAIETVPAGLLVARARATVNDPVALPEWPEAAPACEEFHDRARECHALRRERMIGWQDQRF